MESFQQHLFLCVGMVYDRLHSRTITRYSGLVHVMPNYAIFFMLMTLAAIGLPGTSGFVGEFLIHCWNLSNQYLSSSRRDSGYHPRRSIYAMAVSPRRVWGCHPLKTSRLMQDLNLRELLIFFPLALSVLWMGLFSSQLLNMSAVSVMTLIENYQAALAKP